MSDVFHNMLQIAGLITVGFAFYVCLQIFFYIREQRDEMALQRAFDSLHRVRENQAASDDTRDESII